MEVTIAILSILVLVLILILLKSISSNNRVKSHQTGLEIEINVLKNENTSLKQCIESSKAEQTRKQETLNLANKENADLRAENGRLAERIKTQEEQAQKTKKEMELHFKAIAQEILNEKSEAFKKDNETRLSEILTPFKENINEFKKSINEKYINEAKERFSLQEQIKNLVRLNESLGKDAKELTQALKGNTKMQGDWGEMILKNLLDKSGLTEGKEYEIQVTKVDGEVIKDETNHMLRPDVIVYLPDNKKMIIDSKVSLTAYVDFVNATTKEEQDNYIALHIKSVRNHIKELKDKSYQDFIKDSGDFVMMFIPNEGAYITALQADSNLWQEAYDSRVIIISPTHLISALKLVYSI